ncbi:DUF2059 domain-containing protein [Thalassospira sp. HF15]|uniref:DUF2059 domain-containing protein n=1 Tax=Thalassospira sp. HF15 TaxID=2722755 RepID=UPI00143143DD|nr:DUF2059 domain-containing protein [Thalassospira sp. HF15]NIY76624.1 DUF2059 domain-containing protein [Thalassospira sp. HF15]
MKILRERICYSGLKGLALLLAFLTVVALSNPTFAQDTSEAKLEAAERYAKIFNLPQMMNETVGQIALTVPEDKRQEFIQFMSQALDMQKLESLIVTSMTEHFTTNELNALADFYGSPEGVSIVKKMPVYMASTMPRIQSAVLQAAKKFQ